jgi:hypothetical protein
MAAIVAARSDFCVGDGRVASACKQRRSREVAVGASNMVEEGRAGAWRVSAARRWRVCVGVRAELRWHGRMQHRRPCQACLGGRVREVRDDVGENLRQQPRSCGLAMLVKEQSPSSLSCCMCTRRTKWAIITCPILSVLTLNIFKK